MIRRVDWGILNPTCPNCGSSLYGQDSFGNWRCSSCHYSEAATTLPHSSFRGDHIYLDRLEKQRLDSMSDLERERVRLQRLFLRTQGDLRRYRDDRRVQDLEKLERAAEELVRYRTLFASPERVLRLAEEVKRESRRMPHWFSPRRSDA